MRRNDSGNARLASRFDLASGVGQHPEKAIPPSVDT
jgi:hypothetical protein